MHLMFAPRQKPPPSSLAAPAHVASTRPNGRNVRKPVRTLSPLVESLLTHGLRQTPARAVKVSEALASSTDTAGAPAISADRVGVEAAPHFPPTTDFLQAKLAVGHSDDPLEREADRIADTVLRTPEPGADEPRTRSTFRRCPESGART